MQVSALGVKRLFMRNIHFESVFKTGESLYPLIKISTPLCFFLLFYFVWACFIERQFFIIEWNEFSGLALLLGGIFLRWQKIQLQKMSTAIWTPKYTWNSDTNPTYLFFGGQPLQIRTIKYSKEEKHFL